MILEAALARKARLVLAGITPQKAKIKNLDDMNPLTNSITVLFNPNKITYKRDVTYDSVQVPDEETGERLSYRGGHGATLNMDLFFDTTDTGDDVRDFTDFLIGLTVLNDDTGQPPLCEFSWGEFTTSPYHDFTAVVTELSVDYTWFLPNGKPVRADVHITFKQPDEAMGGTNPTQRSEARKVWVVTEGQTLAWIAFKEYGDCAAWRHIAQVNKLNNPMALRPGMVLKLTPLP